MGWNPPFSSVGKYCKLILESFSHARKILLASASTQHTKCMPNGGQCAANFTLLIPQQGSITLPVHSIPQSSWFFIDTNIFHPQQPHVTLILIILFFWAKKVFMITKYQLHNYTPCAHILFSPWQAASVDASSIMEWGWKYTLKTCLSPVSTPHKYHFSLNSNKYSVLWEIHCTTG